MNFKNSFKILSVFIVLFLTLNISFAKYTIDSKIVKLINNFIKKIDGKFDDNKEKLYLEKINFKIIKILETKKLNTKKEKLLKDILVLFNEEIYRLDYKTSLENKSQKFIEAKFFNILKSQLNNISLPNYIKDISKNKIKKINLKQELIENNEIKKLIFSKYFEVNSGNFNYFKTKNGLFLVNTNNKVWFVEDYKISNKIPFSDSKKLFENFINYKTKFVEEGNNFYSYNFKNYKYLDDKYGFYLEDLKENSIDINNTILYYSENNKYNFITNYRKAKLINGDIIYGIIDKKNFLGDLVNDKLYLTGDTDELFIKLKNDIEKLTKNKSKSEKIKIIYNFILENLEYPTTINLDDKKIFSGILAYKNSSGVCEAYVKLMSYALKFAGISNSRVLRGDVINAVDFPQIGHAWLKIGDLYYDPTFDDPVGNTKTKSFSDYNFFALPKDLLYANRFDYGTTPKKLKSTSLIYRINLVNKNLTKLADKYKYKNYKLLDGIKFNLKNNIEIGENLTIEEAKKIIQYFEVIEKTNGELYFYKNGVKKNIKKLQYYTVDNENINQVLAHLNYNLEGIYLFKWKSKTGNIDYRIGFNVEIK